MYLANVSAMAFELSRLIHRDAEELENKVGAFIESLPAGAHIPGNTLTERARWLIEQAQSHGALKKPQEPDEVSV